MTQDEKRRRLLYRAETRLSEYEAVLRDVWEQFASYTAMNGELRYSAGGLSVLEEVAEALGADPYPDRKVKP